MSRHFGRMTRHRKVEAFRNAFRQAHGTEAQVQNMGSGWWQVNGETVRTREMERRTQEMNSQAQA